MSFAEILADYDELVTEDILASVAYARVNSITR